jgi:hypothetical protein
VIRGKKGGKKGEKGKKPMEDMEMGGQYTHIVESSIPPWRPLMVWE